MEALQATDPQAEQVAQFADMVRLLLGVKHKKQRDLAAALDLSESGLSRKLKDGTWTLRELLMLAQFVGEPVERLFKDPAALLTALGYKSHSADEPPGLTVHDGKRRGPATRALPFLTSVQPAH